MAEYYTTLAPVYDAMGMADYARRAVPLMLDYAQRTDWLGRQILELGCGTGTGINTLADSGFKLTGVDIAPDMLDVAAAKADDVQWEQGDIRKLDVEVTGQQDLIVAVDVMNEMDNVRELQAVFKGVHEILREDRLFMFDMYTIAGLTHQGTQSERLMADRDGLLTLVRSGYDYDRQAARYTYTVFQREDGGEWLRMDAERTLRAYPVQAVSALLQRTGFQDVTVLDEAFESFDPRRQLDRVVFVATT